MKYIFIEYPKCSTCQKAKRWLVDHQIEFTQRHIVKECPSKKELENWILKSGKPVASFFNTSGLVYRNLQLKEKMPNLSEQEKISLLASNGMLIKRPLLIGENMVLKGFKETEWKECVK